MIIKDKIFKRNAQWNKCPPSSPLYDVISHTFTVTMVKWSMGSSIPLGSGMGSFCYREAIVYSRLGPKQCDRAFRKARWEKIGHFMSNGEQKGKKKSVWAVKIPSTYIWVKIKVLHWKGLWWKVLIWILALMSKYIWY